MYIGRILKIHCVTGVVKERCKCLFWMGGVQGFKVYGQGLKVYGSGFKVKVSGFRDQCLRSWGLVAGGFRIRLRWTMAKSQ